MGIEDVVDGKVEETPAVVEAPQEVAPEPVESPEIPETPAPAATEAPAEPEVQEDKSVPLTTFLNMRDEAKEAKRRLAEIEARQPKEAPTVPDPYDDPQGFYAHANQIVEDRVQQERFNWSYAANVRQHGEDTVLKARDWALEQAKANPAFEMQLGQQIDPFDWIVRQQKEAVDLDEYRKDPAAFARRILETSEKPVSPTTVPAVAPQQAPITPPRSLASQPSQGGGVKDVPLGPMAALEAVFPA